MFYPVYNDVFFRNGVNKHVMAGDQCFSKLRVFMTFETKVRLFFQKGCL